MDQLKKKRGENWSLEEKEILRKLISHSVYIIENKSTTTSVNSIKAKEWKNIMKKFNEITMKNRSEVEIKLAWKRMKLQAKANILSHRQKQLQMAECIKPPAPDKILVTNNIVNQDTSETEQTDTNEGTKAKIKLGKTKKSGQYSNDAVREYIIESHTLLKNRQLEMMEVEHSYKVKIAKLKLRKLELEIAVLDSKANTGIF